MNFKTLLLIFLFSPIALATGYDWKPLSTLAIQERGRIKPFNTFAMESVQFVTGKRSWQKQAPEETIFSWLSGFEENWLGAEFVLINYKPLKEEIGIDPNRKYFSPQELTENKRLGELTRQAFEKNQNKEPLDELEKKANEASNRLSLVQAVVSGRVWTILPNPQELESNWFPISSLMEDGQSRPLPYPRSQIEALTENLRGLVGDYTEGKTEDFNLKLGAFESLVKDELAPDAYPATKTLSIEYHYNNFRPFRWAWVDYTLAFLFLLGFVVTQKKSLKLAGLFCFFVGFSLHNYGFVLRMLISGRPPVTNMYESVIWVTWGCVLFGWLIYLIYKQINILTASTAFAIVGLVLADNLPSILDPSINPLEPVLRSNFWLTIHVLTITLSYAAFALSLCLGNVVLGNYCFTPDKTERTKQYSLYMYRAMQIGVVLLAAGTILGGVWADYSWGRFWGWDPKEVWALIALLLYIAVLHGRFTGWLKGFGFAATTVVSFLGVLMAWYGVNFVLGAGLHSYGFGSGGTGYVGIYVLLQLGFIGVAYQRYRAAGKIDSAIFPKGHR